MHEVKSCVYKGVNTALFRWKDEEDKETQQVHAGLGSKFPQTKLTSD